MKTNHIIIGILVLLIIVIAINVFLTKEDFQITTPSTSELNESTSPKVIIYYDENVSEIAVDSIELIVGDGLVEDIISRTPFSMKIPEGIIVKLSQSLSIAPVSSPSPTNAPVSSPSPTNVTELFSSSTNAPVSSQSPIYQSFPQELLSEVLFTEGEYTYAYINNNLSHFNLDIDPVNISIKIVLTRDQIKNYADPNADLNLSIPTSVSADQLSNYIDEAINKVIPVATAHAATAPVTTAPVTTAPVSSNYKVLGSYRDTRNRALEHGPHQYGYTAKTCHEACPNNKYFALQNGNRATTGWCSCSDDLSEVIKYGPKPDCGPTGGGWCNYVFAAAPVAAAPVAVAPVAVAPPSPNQSCAVEGGICKGCNGTVIYGYRGRKQGWAHKKVSGSVACNNNTFGDPIRGFKKKCWCVPSPYEYVGKENDTHNISLAKGDTLLYGQANKWKKIPIGITKSLKCNNASFGDPAYGYKKMCFLHKK